ncbi:Cell cycle checkpoint protein RAD17, partial [Galemys pyrenaicus]
YMINKFYIDYKNTISFNPLAPKNMMTFHQLVRIKANNNGNKVMIPDKTFLEVLCQGRSGNMRSAINSLQFSSSKGENNLWPRKLRVKKNDMVFENQEVQVIGGKDVFLFSALGKILYYNRASLTELDAFRLPFHLSESERILVQPAQVVETSHIAGELFNLYLHQNNIDFFMETDDLRRASEFLSFVDTVVTRTHTLYSGSTVNLKLKGFLPPNSIVAIPCFAYHSNEKSSSVFFYPRYQETSSEINGSQPEKEALGEPTETTESASSLPLSQNNGNELPASQPQPFSTQGDMEEEGMTTEDYGSNGT